MAKMPFQDVRALPKAVPQVKQPPPPRTHIHVGSVAGVDPSRVMAGHSEALHLDKHYTRYRKTGSDR